MSRPLLIRSQKHPYHITGRCNNKEFFPLPLNEVWPIMMKYLRRCHDEHNLAIHAFVLMGNHFHLLCHTPQGNIDECMHLFMRSTSVEISERAKSMNHLWGGRYRWSLIESQRHYYQVYRYIYQNPIRSGLVKNVQDYKWNTLGGGLPFPLHTSVPLSFCGEEGELVWLNERYENEDIDLIRLGLRKQYFDLSQRRLKAFNKLSVPPSN